MTAQQLAFARCMPSPNPRQCRFQQPPGGPRPVHRCMQSTSGPSSLLAVALRQCQFQQPPGGPRPVHRCMPSPHLVHRCMQSISKPSSSRVVALHASCCAPCTTCSLPRTPLGSHSPEGCLVSSPHILYILNVVAHSCSYPGHSCMPLRTCVWVLHTPAPVQSCSEL